MSEKSPLLKKSYKKFEGRCEQNFDQIYDLTNNNRIIFVNSYDLHKKSGTLERCTPDKPYYRFCILALSCFVGFGACICYDSPAPLQEHIRKDIDVTGSQFMALYSWYSWPNIVLCFFGGYLIDKVFGIRFATILFSGLVLAGNIIFSFGAFLSSYWLMCFGRFIFGVGGESLAVAQNFFAILWFKGKEINLVFGLQLSVSRLGSTVSFNALVPLYSQFQKHLKKSRVLGATFLLVSISCLISFICALALIYMDWKAEKIRRQFSSYPSKSNSNLSSSLNSKNLPQINTHSTTNTTTYQEEISNIQNYDNNLLKGTESSISNAQSINNNNNSFNNNLNNNLKDVRSDQTSLGTSDLQVTKDVSLDSTEKSSETVSLRDIKDFPLSVWLINIICVTYYIALFTFIGLGIPFFQNKFGLSLARASVVNSIVYIISAFLSPLLGFVVDRVGRNLTWITCSFLLAILAHSIMGFAVQSNPYVCMSLLGISYSILASALWPLVSYEVPSAQLGTAYGLMQAFMNCGLALFSQVAGALVDYQGYFFLEIFFLCLLFLGLLANAILHMNDKLQSGVLDCNPSLRELRLAAQQAQRSQNKLKLDSKSLTSTENALNNTENIDDNNNFTNANSDYMFTGAGEDSSLEDENDEEYATARADVKNIYQIETNDSLDSGRPTTLFPRSSFYIRNRYLSRIGAQVPRHVLQIHRNPVTLIPYHGGVYPASSQRTNYI